MAKIKIRNLPKALKITGEEMRNVFGGGYYDDYRKEMWEIALESSKSLIDSQKEHYKRTMQMVRDIQKRRQEMAAKIINC